MVKEAIDMFIAAGDWNKAKKVAKELEPKCVTYLHENMKGTLGKKKVLKEGWSLSSCVLM